jgi:hypothetical protein
LANIIKLPQYVWYNPREVDFPLPDNWDVTTYNIAGYDKPAVKPGEIKAAIDSPIGMPPLKEYARGRKEAVKEAKARYVTTNTKDNDTVIANNYTRATGFVVSLTPAVQAVKPEGGSIAINANSPSGQGVHYPHDNFVKTISGDLLFKTVVAPHIKNMVIYTEYPEARILGRFENPDQALQTNDQSRVISTLEKGHGARVAVYPSSDMQYYAD